jgi:hypothetical protein
MLYIISLVCLTSNLLTGRHSRFEKPCWSTDDMFAPLVSKSAGPTPHSAIGRVLLLLIHLNHWSCRPHARTRLIHSYPSRPQLLFSPKHLPLHRQSRRPNIFPKSLLRHRILRLLRPRHLPTAQMCPNSTPLCLVAPPPHHERQRSQLSTFQAFCEISAANPPSQSLAISKGKVTRRPS